MKRKGLLIGFLLLLLVSCQIEGDPLIIELTPEDFARIPTASPVTVAAKGTQRIGIEITPGSTAVPVSSAAPTDLTSPSAASASPFISLPMSSPTPWPEATPWPRRTPWPKPTPWPAPMVYPQPDPPEPPLTPSPSPSPALYAPKSEQVVLYAAPSYNLTDMRKGVMLNANFAFEYQPGQKVLLYGGPIRLEHLSKDACCIGADDTLLLKINGVTAIQFLYGGFTSVPLMMRDALDLTAFAQEGSNQVSLTVTNTKTPHSWLTRLVLQLMTAPPAFENSHGMTFGYLLPGSLMMGSQSFETGAADEQPRHGVSVNGFYLQETEVTQKQWWDVMGAWPEIPPDEALGKGDHYPIYNVSWHDAQAFIARLNAQGKGRYRLPSEAEWEYAARAGQEAAWICGVSASCLNEVAWFDGTGIHPVAQKSALHWQREDTRLYDLSGNVAEWLQDWYGDYGDGENRQSPVGPTDGTHKVIRGGHAQNSAQDLRIGARHKEAPETRSAQIGFRLVWEPE